ncbi:phytoene desaturase family protein [Brevibacillus migulae]|uniref:phytoene desaturase family protein n=1 Tax=Brevibacillus migulae TaxID=1644114 RepID=UPI00106E11F3|nr:FAD-dependent oxidoreductase [Brevibacillus migulae]
MSVKTYDAAVIGGGLAGLIAAIDLAKGGVSTVLLEKSSRVGGRAMTSNKNGVFLNLGAHALYRTGKAFAILQELGVRVEGGRPASQVSVLAQNRLLPLPTSPWGLFSSRLLSWSGKRQLMKMMMTLTKLEPDSLPIIPIKEWVEGEIDDPLVRKVFYALCRTATYTVEPEHLLAGPALSQIQRSLKGGVLYLHGGWQTIVDQLREKAAEAGVHIISNKRVAEIQQENGRVKRLHFADGEQMDVTYVISTAPPAETERLLQGGEHTVLKRWKEAARPSMAACLDLGLTKLSAQGPHFVLDLDRPIYFSNHSLHAQLSANGTVVTHLLKYNGPHESDPKEDERILEETMNLLHPGWEKDVVARQFLPNIAVSHDFPHIGREMARGPEVPEVQGFYVAGDWAGHGEFLADASAASARRAAQSILKKCRQAAVIG